MIKIIVRQTSQCRLIASSIAFCLVGVANLWQILSSLERASLHKSRLLDVDKAPLLFWCVVFLALCLSIMAFHLSYAYFSRFIHLRRNK